MGTFCLCWVNGPITGRSGVLCQASRKGSGGREGGRVRNRSETGGDKTGGRKMRFRVTSNNSGLISAGRPPGGAAVPHCGHTTAALQLRQSHQEKTFRKINLFLSFKKKNQQVLSSGWYNRYRHEHSHLLTHANRRLNTGKFYLCHQNGRWSA